MRLSQLGELGLLAELERHGLIVGVEHDAAQLRDGVVVTQDALVEGVHFRLDWISWRDLGWRAAAVNLSDRAASGAAAEALVVTLAAPAETIVADVVELYRGLAETGVPVVGGDTTAAPQVVLGPGEDAGVVSLPAPCDDLVLVLAHESHNHPSQVLPVEGAATGVGGIVRDVGCMGA